MKIIVNGQLKEVAGNEINVESFAEQNSISDKGTAICLNGKIVRRQNWESTIISDGDTLTIISASYGG